MTIIIDPTGGGDFDTIQQWEDVATDDETVECRSGGDLGGLLLLNANADGVEISAAAGHQHDGTLASFSSSAHADANWSLRLNCTIRGIAGVAFFNTGAQGITSWTIEDCLTVADGIAQTILAINGNASGITIRNNVVYDLSGAGALPRITVGVVASTVANAEITGIVENNSLRRIGGTAPLGIGGRAQATSGRTATCNVTIRNNVAMNYATADFAESKASSGGTETINGTYANNASSDGSADDFGGSDHLVDQTASDWFVDEDDNLKLKAGSPGLLAANTLAGFSTDFEGDPRPDDLWDIGFDQLSTAAISGDAAQTLPSLTQSAAGAVAIAATCAQTLPALSQAAAASVPSNGTAAQTLPSLTQAATGAISVAGQASQTLPAIVQDAAGTSIVGGDGASLLPSVTQAGAGTVFTPVVSIVCIEALDVFCPGSEAVEAAEVFSPHIIAGVFHPTVEKHQAFSPSIDGDVFIPTTEAAQGGCHP